MKVASIQWLAGEEEARRRLARELHDDYSQRLAAAAFELQAIRKRLPEGDPGRAELTDLGRNLAELAEDLRRLSHDLHPATLERRGLIEALRDHCSEIERRSGLEVRLTHAVETEGHLLPEFALGVFRIAQESLANCVRHASAHSVLVTLRLDRGRASLAVADDGVGFDPAAPRDLRHQGGLGLVILAERAKLLGGRSWVTSAPGSGTKVEVVVPLPGSAGHLVRRHRRVLISVALVILALVLGLGATRLWNRAAKTQAGRNLRVFFFEP